MTNTTPVVAITSPANNYLTINSTINVRGTVKGSGGETPEVSVVQLAVNTNAARHAPLALWQKTVELVHQRDAGSRSQLDHRPKHHCGTNTNTAFATAPGQPAPSFMTRTPPSPKIKST